MEDLFDQFKDDQVTPDPALFSLLFQTVDAIGDAGTRFGVMEDAVGGDT